MEWNETDRDKFSAYITQTKGKLFDYIRAKIPKAIGTNFEEVALASQKKEGHEEAIENLIQASQRLPESRTESANVDVTEGLVR